MARFGNVAELATFLGKLDVDYAEYAPALWQKGVKFPQQLANFSEPHYLACDVPEGHIDDIKARADTTGRNSTEGEAGPSKKPWTGHISETPLTAHSELLVNQYLCKPLPDSFLPLAVRCCSGSLTSQS
ncbi:TPA: hypothetical protein ACH3X3_001086 [Trebouxia sp. C0006]